MRDNRNILDEPLYSYNELSQQRRLTFRYGLVLGAALGSLAYLMARVWRWI